MSESTFAIIMLACGFAVGVVLTVNLCGIGVSGVFKDCELIGKTRYGGKVYECRKVGEYK